MAIVVGATQNRQRALQRCLPSIRETLIPRLCPLEGLHNSTIYTEILTTDYVLNKPQCSSQPATLQPLDSSTSTEFMLAPSVLWSGKDDDCKTLEKGKSKKKTVCQSPDLRPKEVPPYDYGYCKEPRPPMPMSCPPKAVKSMKGPCCQDGGGSKGGGGCQNK